MFEALEGAGDAGFVEEGGFGAATIAGDNAGDGGFEAGEDVREAGGEGYH